MNHSTEHSTDLLRLAARFVNNTDRHIFLTGKAGTGKTTFLRDITERTHKRCLICAPTGIAALNAKGVTVHSQFMLPLGAFVPDRELPEEAANGSGAYTERTLAVKHTMNQLRIRVLRSIDLLVIDEVSMLRADTLDAVDFRLRQARRNRLPFGGVQLLLIGDLNQLPPIVKDHERGLYQRYYASPHFFRSQALVKAGFVRIELDKIFRQENPEFIGLLNRLRDNCLTSEDINTLNRSYTPNPPEDETIITLCTHNYRADQINEEAMRRLKTRSFTLEAEVIREFPESMYPLPDRMEMKPGARVMFIKNDTRDNLYVNGNLGTLTALDEELEVIRVQLDGGEEIAVGRETWENKRYTLNETTRDLDEEVIGTFEQFPIRPAWAVTVHKSQGLTFVKAILDLDKAFAPGQVYVALSRLTGPEGLILRSPIRAEAVSTDQVVDEFNKQPQTPPQETLARATRDFLEKTLTTTFDFNGVIRQIEHISGKKSDIVFEDDEMNQALNRLRDDIESEAKNTETFRQHIRIYLSGNEGETLKERLGKASDYYDKKLRNWMLAALTHMADCEKFTGTKGYRELLGELDVMLMNKWHEVQKSQSLGEAILNDREPERNQALEQFSKTMRHLILEKAQSQSDERIIAARGKSGRVRSASSKKEKKPKKEKGETYRVTYEMIDAGKGPEQVAVERGLTVGTILGHLARGIEEGKYSAEQFFPTEDYSELKAAIAKTPDLDYNRILAATGNRFNQGHIRMMLAEMRKAEE